MVVQERVNAIIMLCDDKEMKMDDFCQYWPVDEGGEDLYGGII